MIIEGSKFEGKILVSQHLNLVGNETLDGVQVDEINENNSNANLFNFLIEIQNKLSSNSWGIKLNIDGNEAFGVAVLQKNVLKMKSCITMKETISTNNNILTFDSKFYITLIGKFNLTYDKLCIDFESFADGDQFVINDLSGFSFTFCAEQLGNGCLKFMNKKKVICKCPK